VLVARVRRTILERALLPRGASVLVACSGGPDSTALLLALAELSGELGLSLHVASVDHGLRPDAAADVAIAREQALRIGVAFHALRVTVEPGASRQGAARRARYAALRSKAAELAASRITVGHTLDDQAETVLLRMLRGAGAAGLSGIDPLRADGVARPLIDCPRAEVHAFARASGLPIARDPSNADATFARVRVRQELLPWLEREDPQIVAHLSAIADDARATQAAMSALARPLLEAALQSSQQAEGMFDLSSWRDQPSALQRVALRALLEPHLDAELGRAHIEQLERSLWRGGEVWLPGQHLARSTGDGHLLVTVTTLRRNQ
jgi:tRNA(Ile)-lysidine synthase